MMGRGFILFFISSLFLFADSASRHLLLPEDTWEVSLAYSDSPKFDSPGIYIPFRYGITKRLEFIPLGLKYLAYDSKKDQLAVYAYITSFGYGIMNGWSYHGGTGMIWRNTSLQNIRINVVPIFLHSLSEIGEKKKGYIALNSVYTLNSRWETGLRVSYSNSTDKDHYENSSYDSSRFVTKTERIVSGMFVYWFLSENLNLKFGLYGSTSRERRDNRTEELYDRRSDTTFIMYRIDWRF